MSEVRYETIDAKQIYKIRHIPADMFSEKLSSYELSTPISVRFVYDLNKFRQQFAQKSGYIILKGHRRFRELVEKGYKYMDEFDVRQIKVPRLESTGRVRYPDVPDKELMKSIAKLGMIQPLECIQIHRSLVLSDGHHRLLCAKKLGLKTVPCVVRYESDNTSINHYNCY